MTKMPTNHDVPCKDAIDYAIAKAVTDGDHTMIFITKTKRGVASVLTAEFISKVDAYCTSQGVGVTRGVSRDSLVFCRTV